MLNMELSAEEFVEKLLTKEAEEQPSDNVKPEELVMELPKDFDERKFKQGQRLYSDHSFMFTTSMLMGLVAVLAIPSILKVLVSTKRSSSAYTAYRRYLSTIFHTVSWFEYDLKPGSVSWRSLYAVRSRHLRAAIAGKLKGTGIVSQRDVALTQFGFVGYSMLIPDKLGIRQLKAGDWEAYNYFWRTIGHMIGLEDKYNICRPTHSETVEVCKILQERVFTPCLENVPEYFEHMARTLLDGLWSVNPGVETDSFLYICRAVTEVPGYIYTEEERLTLQLKLKKCLKGKSIDTGVDSRELMKPVGVQGLPERPPRLLYYNDYNTLETAPAYAELGFRAKYKLYLSTIYLALYTSYIGRLFINFNFQITLFCMRYFPYLGFFRFGVQKAFVNMFEEDPADDTKPKTNAEIYEELKQPKSLIKEVLALLW